MASVLEIRAEERGLTPRQLLQQAHDQRLSAEELAKLLKVDPKSVRNYVKDHNGAIKRVIVLPTENAK